MAEKTIERRRLLRGMCVLPLAVAPIAAAAVTLNVAGVATSPDAVLIAQAAVAEALAARTWAALQRSCDLQEKLDDLTLDCPKRPSTPGLTDTLPSVERDSFDRITCIRFQIDPRDSAAERAHEIAEQEYVSASEAWHAEEDRISRRIGLRAAGRLHDRLYRRLEAATRNLTPLTPTTFAGLAAKARVAAALDPHGDFSFNDWEYDVMAAVVRDAAAIGGAA